MARKLLVVLDTNVFVSGLLSPNGPPGAIVRQFRRGDFQVATSKSQLSEVREVLGRPSLAKFLPKGTAKEMLKFLTKFKGLTFVFDPPILEWEFEDPDDHFLLDLIVDSKADYLVPGDKALRMLVQIGNCAVVSPTDFIAKL